METKKFYVVRDGEPWSGEPIIYEYPIEHTVDGKERLELVDLADADEFYTWYDDDGYEPTIQGYGYGTPNDDELKQMEETVRGIALDIWKEQEDEIVDDYVKCHDVDYDEVDIDDVREWFAGRFSYIVRQWKVDANDENNGDWNNETRVYLDSM